MEEKVQGMAIPEAVRQEEEAYLEKVKNHINRQIEAKTKELGEMRKDRIEKNKYIHDEVKLKNQYMHTQDDSVTDKIYEQKYHRISELNRMYHKPYFGSILFSDSEGKTSKRYIGKYALNFDNELAVLDWRTPVASLFYQQRLGKMTYQAPAGVMSADLLQRRQYIIKNAELKGLFDSDIDIKDDVLQMVLSGNSGSRLKEIIATIQKEQDDVIRLSPECNVILNGVAGSGKTTIILHRIAYLLYNYRSQLNNNILILGPNRLFMEYISDVLPDLGESDNTFQDTVKGLSVSILKPKRPVMRMRDYYERILAGKDMKFAEEVRRKSSLAFKKELDKAFAQFEEEQRAVRDLVFQSHVIISKEDRNELFFKTNARLPYFKRIERVLHTIRDLLRDVRRETIRHIQNAYRYKMKQAREAGDIFTANELVLEESEAIRAYLRECYRFTRSLRTLYADMDLEEWYGKFVGKKETDEWVEDDLIALLYLKTKLEGRGCYPVKYLVMDEAQDISAFGFYVLRQMTGADSYTVVGDRRQKIRGANYHSMMEEWEQVLNSAEKEQVRAYELHRSYRSTKQIIDYARTLLKRDSDVDAVDRGGAEVKHLTFNTPIDLVEKVVEAAKEMSAAPEIEHTAILCRTIADAQSLYAMLQDKLPCTLISREEDKPDDSILIMPVYFAKGLEFDGVVAVEAAPQDDDGELSYILCTRALHRLTHITLD